jgi:hypothetical protein
MLLLLLLLLLLAAARQPVELLLAALEEVEAPLQQQGQARPSSIFATATMTTTTLDTPQNRHQPRRRLRREPLLPLLLQPQRQHSA